MFDFWVRGMEPRAPHGLCKRADAKLALGIQVVSMGHLGMEGESDAT